MTDGGRVSVSTRRLPRGRGCEDASEAGTSGGAAGSALSEDDGTAESAWVEVVVEDEGPGFPPEESSRIFDPFFTTKTAKRGMGIGLKICRDIVMEHGGRLHVESGRERGARVVVEMPGSGKAPDGRSSEGEAGWPWGSSSVASA
jgi:signal transduction histidine kinase